MAEELLNFIANDGSRQFGELPQTVLWYEMRDHIENLVGAEITDFLTDHVTEAWIDFTYCGYRFTVNDQWGIIGSSLMIRVAPMSFSKQFSPTLKCCLGKEEKHRIIFVGAI